MIDRSAVRALVRATAYDLNGWRLGRVAQVFLDDRTDEPAWVAVDVARTKGLRLLPLAGAGLKGKHLVVRAERTTARSAPRIDLGDGQLSSQDEARLLEHYGLAPGERDEPGEREEPGKPGQRGDSGAKDRAGQRPAAPWLDESPVPVEAPTQQFQRPAVPEQDSAEYQDSAPADRVEPHAPPWGAAAAARPAVKGWADPVRPIDGPSPDSSAAR